MCSATNKLVHINPSQIKDFLRASILEDIFHPCCIHTVTMCGDELRHNDTLSQNELNVDVCTKDFITQIIEKGWKIDEICMDHYRMMDSYSSSKLGKSFFENLIISALPEIVNPLNTKNQRSTNEEPTKNTRRTYEELSRKYLNT